jgi:hypothetical protein
MARSVHIIIKDAIVYDNISSRVKYYSDGGGILFWAVESGHIDATQIISNATHPLNGQGGGLSMHYGDAVTVTNSLFMGNRTNEFGGGIGIFQMKWPLVVKNTDFISNSAGQGGGLGMLSHNNNGSDLILDRARFQGNKTGLRGAAIWVEKNGSWPGSFEMSNLLITDNSRGLHGHPASSVIEFQYPRPNVNVTMAHLTVADNEATSFLRVEAPVDGDEISVILTNTLISGVTNAFTGYKSGIDGDITIKHTKTWTYTVDTLHYDETGAANFIAVDTLTGDPYLMAGYYPWRTSPLINAGAPAGVPHDLIGMPRDNQPDIGAFEFTPVNLPIVMRS